MALHSTDIVIFLLSIGVILFFSRAIGELFRYFNQPIIIGEIIAGIILGPTLLGWFFPDVYYYLFSGPPVVLSAFNGITQLGLVMLLLVLGLEIDLGLALSQGKTASLVSFFGILFPFAIGFGITFLFPLHFGILDEKSKLTFALFIGTALSITALPVVAKMLMDLKIFKTEIGLLVITSAMFNDLVGWLIFSVILGMMGLESNRMDLGWLLISLFAFTAFALIIGRKIINHIIPFLEKKTAYPGGIINFIFIMGFMCAALTEFIGIHAIFGAFIIGIAIGDSAHLKEQTREIIQQFVTNIFAPIFFVSIGLRINFIENFDLLLVLAFLAMSIVGKVLGSFLGGKLGGLKKIDILIVSTGLNAHGAMEIILGTIALQAGLIHERVFVALVLMALITSTTTAPLMSLLVKRKNEKTGLFSFLPKDNILFVQTSDKKVLIKELCDTISIKNKIDSAKLFNEVWAREVQLSTGLEKHIAIPHARFDIKTPIAALAINKAGVDFSSFDNLPSKIIFLLITPKDQPEVQINLLSEIANKFKDINNVEKIINSTNSDELISNMKQLS